MATSLAAMRFKAAIQRELGMRRRVYPKWVAAKRMSQKKADEEIQVMADLLAFLAKLEDNTFQLDDEGGRWDRATDVMMNVMAVVLFGSFSAMLIFAVVLVIYSAVAPF